MKTPARAISRRSVGIVEAEVAGYRYGNMLPSLRGGDWHTADLNITPIPGIKIDRDGGVGRGVDVDQYVKAQGGVPREVHGTTFVRTRPSIIADGGNKIAEAEIGGTGGGVRGSVARQENIDMDGAGDITAGRNRWIKYLGSDAVGSLKPIPKNAPVEGDVSRVAARLYGAGGHGNGGGLGVCRVRPASQDQAGDY